MTLSSLLPMEIAAMRFIDLPQVAALEAAAQVFPWREEHFTDSLHAGDRGWVLWRGAQCLGFVLSMHAADEAHLLNLAVAPAVQRQGLGAKLLRHVLRDAAAVGIRRMYLETRASNQRAQTLYSAFGFQEIGLRKAYYPNGNGREDALVFCASLDNWKE
ncbi:MAG: ribosomal protein S18-alanine N-acetyltransferase [Zoogloeaceae bacterium]|jgi:ribosomal-protein-alanine acetyltransferase|nr:ribosomal protein S18-alanine N-acetyltransferase [Zoogloeaceae bacterium]